VRATIELGAIAGKELIVLSILLLTTYYLLLTLFFFDFVAVPSHFGNSLVVVMSDYVSRCVPQMALEKQQKKTGTLSRTLY
jgi:hypothetical protein